MGGGSFPGRSITFVIHEVVVSLVAATAYLLAKIVLCRIGLVLL